MWRLAQTHELLVTVYRIVPENLGVMVAVLRLLTKTFSKRSAGSGAPVMPGRTVLDSTGRLVWWPAQCGRPA
jgi:hypothetical protein